MMKLVKSSLATMLALLTLSTSTSRALDKEAVKRCILGVSAGLGISAVAALGIAKFVGNNSSNDENNSKKNSSNNSGLKRTNPGLSQKRAYSNVPLVGIKNFYYWGCSMQCFANATLQVLFSCPEFVNYIRNVENETLIDDPQDGGVEQHKVDILISNLKAILTKMENSNGKAIDVYNEVNHIRKFFTKTGQNSGGDSAMLFGNIYHILDACSTFKEFYSKDIFGYKANAGEFNAEIYHQTFEKVGNNSNVVNYELVEQPSKEYVLGNYNNQKYDEDVVITHLATVYHSTKDSLQTLICDNTNLSLRTLVPLENDNILQVTRNYHFLKNGFILFTTAESEHVVERLNIHGKNYKLVAFSCANGGHEISCVATDDDGYVVIDDSRCSKRFSDLNDVLSYLGKRGFISRIVNYRLVN